MEFLKLKRLGDVQEKLRLVLRELGLKPRYDRNSLSGRDICFENEDGSLHHSVSIHVTDTVFTDSLNPWKGSCLRIKDVGEEPLGYGEWKFVEWGCPTDTPRFRGDIDEIFSEIAMYLKEYPVLRVRNSHPDLIDNTEFVRALREVEQSIQDKTDCPITVTRIDGVLSISFELADERWRIEFLDFVAKLIINDLEIDRTCFVHHEKVNEMLWKELEQRKVPDIGY